MNFSSLESKTKSIILFLFGCIPTRLLLVYLAKNHLNLLPYLRIITIAIAIGFLAIYFLKLRETGGETFGEKIWWNDLRPLHAMLYLTFAYMTVYEPKNAWIVLLVDVILGFGAFVGKRLI